MKHLSANEQEALLQTLSARFEKNMKRHKSLEWSAVKARLLKAPTKLYSLHQMEHTGGEPDVIGLDSKTGEYLFCDCCAETPAGRRSVCYDREGLESRKENRPLTSAMDLAAEMGVELLTEVEYFNLQKLGTFDNKTSSWLKTPGEIRALGGAIFGDSRYGRVFIYHNGAQSYYASRAFRAGLRV